VSGESALEVADRALAVAEADEAEAFVNSERSGLARFAGDEVHQPTLVANTLVRLRLVRDGRVGSAATNRLSDEGLRAAAGRAQEAADRAPRDPDWPGLAAPAEPPAVAGYDEETAELSPGEQASHARAALSTGGGLGVYGYYTSGVVEVAVATTTGQRVAQAATDATALVLAADEGASGYADRTSSCAREVDPAAVAREAVEKARRTRNAETVEPGTYRAVLEPYAVAELLETFAWDAFNGLALLEERSALTGKLGERIFDERVSIAEDPVDPAGLPKAFDFEGTPRRRVPLVEDGVARGVLWDRTLAARAGGGQESTGSALPADARVWGAMPVALSVAAGEAESLEELAGLVGEGIHVTRLHYLGIVDPREGIVTGMTRDGTFRIRDGRVAEPLANLRFTVSVPRLLADVPGLTRSRRLVNRSDFYGERYAFGVVCPALATAAFTITGSGSAPGL
jgi:PmbA protein